jgi:hypothetical protein
VATLSCRCPQTLLLEATMEWKHGFEHKARAAFRKGAKCAHGPSSTYSPLLQAWAQFEDAHGNREQADARMQEYLAAESAQQRRSSDNTLEVIELVEALGLGCSGLESPLPDTKLSPQPV